MKARLHMRSLFEVGLSEQGMFPRRQLINYLTGKPPDFGSSVSREDALLTKATGRKNMAEKIARQNPDNEEAQDAAARA